MLQIAMFLLAQRGLWKRYGSVRRPNADVASRPVGAAVKHAHGRIGSRPQQSRRARVATLLDRLEQEADPRKREMIEAQLRAFGVPAQGATIEP